MNGRGAIRGKVRQSRSNSGGLEEWIEAGLQAEVVQTGEDSS